MRAIHSYGSIPKSLRSASSLSSRDSDEPSLHPKHAPQAPPRGPPQLRTTSWIQTATTTATATTSMSNEEWTSSRFFSVTALLVAVFFLASGVAILFTEKQDQQGQGVPTPSASISNLQRLGNENKAVPATITSAAAAAAASADSSWNVLSQRGRDIHPVRNDIDMFLHASLDAYHPIDNPTGYLNMIVAENRLMQDELAEKLTQVTSNTSIPQWTLNYGDMTGQHDFKVALADMMQSSWLQHVPVDPSALVVQAGAGSILDSLAWTLADAGDAVLTTGPAYAAFAGDFYVHGQVVLYVTPTTAENQYEPTLDDLEQTYQRAVQAGHVPRIFIICQPHNPTGTVYSPAALHRIMAWAQSKTSPPLHVVSDEIYGNSVFPGVPVTSAAHVMYEWYNNNNNNNNTPSPNNNTTSNYLGDRVHIVAGLSKDWGMSGLRIGTLFTHNTALQQALALTSYYNSVSLYTQWAVTRLLQDQNWTQHYYLPENQRRLYETFQALQDALALVNVTVYPHTQGGIFAWVDASSLLRLSPLPLPELDPNGPMAQQQQQQQQRQQQQTITITEQELWMDLYENAQILWTLGESFYEEKPGMFRIVYTWPTGGVQAMQEMGRRLVQWNSQRRQKWEERQLQGGR